MASALLAALCGCHGDVAVSPPAEPRMALRPEALGPFVRMNQVNAERYFVSGVYKLEENAWRWCAGRAVLRLQLGAVENLKFTMKYAVPQQVIAHSKSVRMRLFLNGRAWEEMRYDKDGIYEIDKPVPAGLLLENAENLLTIEIDKPLPAQSDRREMGFILVQAGMSSQ